jgi:hypothetical protein
VTPENSDWNQVRGAASIGPPDQKNFASSGDLPRQARKRSSGFSI